MLFCLRERRGALGSVLNSLIINYLLDFMDTQADGGKAEIQTAAKEEILQPHNGPNPANFSIEIDVVEDLQLDDSDKSPV
jgi:hypothetical protein